MYGTLKTFIGSANTKRSRTKSSRDEVPLDSGSLERDFEDELFQLDNDKEQYRSSGDNDSQLEDKLALYESQIQDLRVKQSYTVNRLSRQILDERRKFEAHVKELELKFQEEFDQFDQHHLHEIKQLQRDYESRLARLNRELHEAHARATQLLSKPPSKDQITSTDDSGTSIDHQRIVELLAQLGAANDQKSALQHVLSSILRGFVRIKLAVLPDSVDSNFESCLLRLFEDSSNCKSLVEQWTDQVIEALPSHNETSVANDDPDSKSDFSDREAQRLARSVAELRQAKCELEFRIESKELEISRQLEEKDSLIAERDAQIDASQRQIRSLRCFIDELLVDREAERDEHVRRISQLETSVAKLSKRAGKTRVGVDFEEENEYDLSSDDDESAQNRKSKQEAPLNSTMNEGRAAVEVFNEPEVFVFEQETEEADRDAVDSLNSSANMQSTAAATSKLASAATKQLELSIGLYDELLTERNEEVAFLNRQIEQLTEELAILKSQQSSARSTTDRVDAAEQTDEIELQSAPVAVVQPDKNGDLREEVETLQKVVDTLQTELAIKDGDVEAAEAQLATMEEELRKMMLYNESLTRDFEDVQSMLERKQNELERLQDEADERLQLAVRSATTNYEKLLASSTSPSASTAKKRAVATSETFNERDEEFYMLEDRIRELSAQRDALQLKLTGLQDECASLRRVNADLQEQMQTRLHAQSQPQPQSKPNEEAGAQSDSAIHMSKDVDGFPGECRRSPATYKNDAAILDAIQRYQEHLVKLLADWSKSQSEIGDVLACNPPRSDTRVKEARRKLEREFEKLRNLDGEIRSYLSWQPIVLDDDRNENASQTSTSKHQSDSIVCNLPPLLRSKLHVADPDFHRCCKLTLEFIDNRLRQERLISEQLKDLLESEHCRLLEVSASLARENCHVADLMFELQSARANVEHVNHRLETELQKRRQLENLNEKQRSDILVLQTQVWNATANGSVTLGDSGRIERLVRQELEQERRKRSAVEAELERYRSEHRTKRREFDELAHKLQNLERVKVDESVRFRKELQRIGVQKDLLIEELRRKLSDAERQLADASVQNRNLENSLRECKTRGETERERSLHLESVVQQLRSRLHVTVRTSVEEKAALLSQIEREKAFANRQVFEQAAVIEQLTASNGRQSAAESRIGGSGVPEVIVDELYQRLHRSEVYRQSLAFQKHYLIALLSGFNQTVLPAPVSNDTIAASHALDDPDGVCRDTEGRSLRHVTKSKRVGVRKFRVGACVVIAAFRLSRLRRRWCNVRCPVSPRALAKYNGTASASPSPAGRKSNGYLLYSCAFETSRLPAAISPRHSESERNTLNSNQP